MLKIPSKLEVAPYALKMLTGWVMEWMGDTPETVATTFTPVINI